MSRPIWSPPICIECQLCATPTTFDAAVPVMIDGRGRVYCRTCAKEVHARPVPLDEYRQIARQRDMIDVSIEKMKDNL